jgi:hypothetical protein
MKSESKVKQKLKQVLFRHLKKRLTAALKAAPETCLYNRAPHGVENKLIRKGWTRKLPNGHLEGEPDLWAGRDVTLTDVPRICIHVEQAGHVCDRSHENSIDFAGCPFFTPAKSKETTKREFVELAKGRRDLVAEYMPDAAALMWVLEQEGGVPEVDVESAANGDAEEDEPEEPDPARVQAALRDLDVELVKEREETHAALQASCTDALERRDALLETLKETTDIMSVAPLTMIGQIRQWRWWPWNWGTS